MKKIKIINKSLIYVFIIFLYIAFFDSHFIQKTKATTIYNSGKIVTSSECCGCGSARGRVCKPSGTKYNDYLYSSYKCYTSECSSTSHSSCQCKEDLPVDENGYLPDGTRPEPTPLPVIPKDSKCSSWVMRECNDFPKKDDGITLQDKYVSLYREDNCGWSKQIDGCGKLHDCYLGDCCTATKPIEAKNMIITTNREKIFSRDNIAQRQVFSWFGGSFGKGCPTNDNKIAIQFFDNTTTKVIGGTGWTTEDTITDITTIRPNNKYINLLNTIYKGYICTNDVKWRVAKTNGTQKSYSNFETFSIKDVEPEITKLTSSAAENDNNADTNSEIQFSVTAEGPYIRNIEVGIIEYDTNFNLINEYKRIGVKNCSTKNLCNYDFSWITPDTTDRIYKVQAWATNQCLETKNVADYYLNVKDRYSIEVKAFKFDKLLNSSESPNCSADKEPQTSGIITLSSLNQEYSKTIELDNSNTAVFDFIPEDSFPLYINAQIDNNDCREYNFYCINDTNLNDFNQIDIPTNGKGEYNISFGENKSDSWVTFFDSDVYSTSINISSKCDRENEQSNFVATTITKTEQGIGGNLFTAEDIYTETENILNPSTTGVLIESLDTENSRYDKTSNDRWLNGFIFPEYQNLPQNITEIRSIDDINENNNIYYVNSDLSVNNETQYNTNGVSVVYVNGDLNINNSVVASNNGFITFIVNGAVKISNDFGINDFIEEENYNVNTKPNLQLGIISLDETRGIEFLGTNDYIENPDNPLIFEGMLLSKGYIKVNRDLGEYNPTYPAIVLKYQGEYLSKFRDIANITTTGIELFDIQWEYIN